MIYVNYKLMQWLWWNKLWKR